MKKFLIVCAIIFIAGVGCKKTNVDGGGLCACSPIRVPELNLVIKNSAGDDLLSDKTTGAYTKDKIQLYKKDAEGKTVPIAFSIRQPFSYGNDKFKFNTINSQITNFLQNSENSTAYLKLGDNDIYELKVELIKEKYDVAKLLIDGQEAEKGEGDITHYVTVFYLTK